MPTNRITDNATSTNYDFVATMGVPVTSQQNLARHTRPGVDGIMYRRTGKRGRRYVIRTVVDKIHANLDTWEASCRSAVGHTVTYYDAAGNDWGPHMLVDITDVRIDPSAGSVGGITASSNIVVHMNWTIESLAPLLYL
jgi:hypothetical protein